LVLLKEVKSNVLLDQPIAKKPSQTKLEQREIPQENVAQEDSIPRSSIRFSNTDDPLSASNQYQLKLDREEALKVLGNHGYFNLITNKQGDYQVPAQTIKVGKLK
jgi:hypothetical protein